MRTALAVVLFVSGLAAGLLLSRPASADGLPPVCNQVMYRLGAVDFDDRIAQEIAAQRAKGYAHTDFEDSDGSAYVCSW